MSEDLSPYGDVTTKLIKINKKIKAKIISNQNCVIGGLDFAKEAFDIDLYKNKKEELPESREELDLYMQLTYKQSIELAEEQALNVLLEGNKYELTKKRFYRDLTVCGIGAVKTTFNDW